MVIPPDIYEQAISRLKNDLPVEKYIFLHIKHGGKKYGLWIENTEGVLECFSIEVLLSGITIQQSILHSLRLAAFATDTEDLIGLLNAEVSWHELGAIRAEIFASLIISHHLSAMALCNLYAEDLLKTAIKRYEQLVKKGIVCDDNNMGKNISLCKRHGLITKEQADDLDDIRSSYRNAFGHANHTQMLKSDQLAVYYEDGGRIVPMTVNVANTTLFNGLIKNSVAIKAAKGYFSLLTGIHAHIEAVLATKSSMKLD